MVETQFKSGFIALLGRSGVGKSTLMNRLLQRKVSIVSPKPQTTRGRILGIKTLREAQLLFLDTPGIHASSVLLNRKMIKTATAAAADADLILGMVDATEPLQEDDDRLFHLLAQVTRPVLLAINKVDAVAKPTLLPLIETLRQKVVCREIIPISAREGDNLEQLEDLLIRYLPEGPPLYPEDQVTDQPREVFLAEIIREKVILFTEQEIPYAVAVGVESVTPREAAGLTAVEATIWVEKESQKGIIIGAGGTMLKKIGEAARREIEVFLETRVYLRLWVKVRRNWRRDEAALQKLLYRGV